MLRAVGALADALGLRDRRRGRRAGAQAAVITALGLRHAQGFLYSPAVPAERFPELLDAPFAERAASRVPLQLRVSAG